MSVHGQNHHINSKIYDLIETQLFGSCENNKIKTTETASETEEEEKNMCARAHTQTNSAMHLVETHACMHVPASAHVEHT